jgi:hypothetical protein
VRAFYQEIKDQRQSPRQSFGCSSHYPLTTIHFRPPSPPAPLPKGEGRCWVHAVLLVFRPVTVMPALAIDERMSVSAWILRRR